MIHFVTIIDFLTATLKKKYVRVKQKKSLEQVNKTKEKMILRANLANKKSLLTIMSAMVFGLDTKSR